MRYSKKTINYPKRIKLFDLTHMISMTNLVAINAETPMIDSGCSLEKAFTALICINQLMVLYQLSIMLIHMMVVYVILSLETPKTS